MIVHTPRPVSALADLSPEELTAALEVWRERLRAHASAACRHLFVNEGRAAGASLPHTHAQLYALDFVPALIARERERFAAYATRTMGGNLLADLVQEEVRRRDRIVAIDDEAVLMAPYASIAPFQLLLAPRRPRAAFEDEGPLGAALLHDALQRLRRRLGALAAAEPVGAHGAPGGRDVLLADRHRAQARAARGARAGRRRPPLRAASGARRSGAARHLKLSLRILDDWPI